MIRFFSLTALVVLAISPVGAQPRFQTDFTAEDFQTRRKKIFDVIGNNLAVIQGAEDVQGHIVFRQSNTLYYLSGLEVAIAYMLLDCKAGIRTSFQPEIAAFPTCWPPSVQKRGHAARRLRPALSQRRLS